MNRYRIKAEIEFDIEADNRAAAHIAGVDALTLPGLPGFDLVKLDAALLDYPAEAFRSPTRERFTAANSRPDFSSLDPTPLGDRGPNDPAYAPIPPD